MSKRTILLITDATLGRFDLSGGAAPTVTSSWVRPSFTSQSAGTLVDAALRLGKSRRRQVYVLTTRCWTGSVAIGPDLVSGSSGDDLEQMVALEAETYSGISAFESSTSIRPLPPDALGDARFWLTQIPDTDLRSIDEAVRQAGGKLVGIGHPAVPTVDAKGPTEPWSSLQNWDEATLLIRGCGGAIADFHSMSSGLQSQRTLQEFEAFFQTQGSAAAPFTAEEGVGSGSAAKSKLQWIGPGELPHAIAGLPEAVDCERFDSGTESDLKRWASAWMRTQAKQAVSVPLVTIPKRPMSKEAGIAIAAVLGLLMMAACFAHYRHLQNQLAEMDANIARMQGQKDQLKSDEDRVKALQKDAEEAESEAKSSMIESMKIATDNATAAQIIEANRRRWLALVDSSIDVSDDSVWLSEIQSTEGTVSLRGLAIDDASVHRLAARLESTDAAKYWQVLPASTTVEPDTTLIGFTIDLLAVSGNDKKNKNVDTEL
ncbi:MAG: hypothetical protein AAF802_12205 [Planctomycetota bacterium]